MESLPESIDEYRKQLHKGMIQKAYRGLMQYIMDIKNHFEKKYPGKFVSGSLYSGYMDMTYFPLFPESLKQKGLKIAVVFVHEAFRFEVWLSAINKNVQEKYWRLFKENGAGQYRLVPSTKGYDSILEHVLAADPDFRDLDELTNHIEKGTLKFIQDVEEFLREK